MSAPGFRRRSAQLSIRAMQVDSLRRLRKLYSRTQTSHWYLRNTISPFFFVCNDFARLQLGCQSGASSRESSPESCRAPNSVCAGHNRLDGCAYTTLQRAIHHHRALHHVAFSCLYVSRGIHMTLCMPLLARACRLGRRLLRSLLRSEVGVVAHRRAWHDSRKLTPEVLAQYKAPLQVDGWDRALIEVP